MQRREKIEFIPGRDRNREEEPKRCKWFGEDDEKGRSRYGRLIINKRSQGEQSKRDGGDRIEKTQAIDNVEPIMWQTLSVGSVSVLCMQCSFSISPDALCLGLAEVFSTVLKKLLLLLATGLVNHINKFPIWILCHALISVSPWFVSVLPKLSDSEH